MAGPGHYKQLKSTNLLLEIKRAGRDHVCSGVFLERGNRPGNLKDVWIMGRSRRCLDKIRQNTFYVANRILPPHFLADMMNYEQWVPTCMVCAIETYGEFIEGPEKSKYLRPMTPEIRKNVKNGLVQILDETRAIVLTDVEAEL